MVPVSAFAAVVAMAGPQRLAAESSVQEAADDLAVFAVAWRDGHQTPDGSLFAFPPDCEAETPQQETELAALDGEIQLLPTLTTGRTLALIEADLNALYGYFKLQPPNYATDKLGLRSRFDDLTDQLDEWEKSCEALRDALWRDLGYLGVNFDSARGLYSDSLAESSLVGGTCSDLTYTDQTTCESNSKTWTRDSTSQYYLPCRTAEETVVRDAVHVALAADWQDAGWAAAQVWPDGMPMAAESTGRLSQSVTGSTEPGCRLQLVTVNDQGQPEWARGSPTPPSRELVQSVGRTTLSD